MTIEANANDEGHLYGSVGAVEIVAALKRNKITIAHDQVRLQGPLKELGLYTVMIHVAQEIEGELKVWVVPSVAEGRRGRKNPRLSEPFHDGRVYDGDRWGDSPPGPSRCNLTRAARSVRLEP